MHAARPVGSVLPLPVALYEAPLRWLRSWTWCGLHASRLKQLRASNDDFQFRSFEETGRFLRAAASDWKTFLLTALKTSLRVGELLALKWEGVDLVAGRIVVRRTLWHDQEGTPKV